MPLWAGADRARPFAPHAPAAGHLEAVERVKDWVRRRFVLGDGDTVVVSEVAGTLPGCPPLQTAISFWSGGMRHHFTIFKRVEDALEEDVPPAWMKSALALSEGLSCDCC